MVNCCRTLDNGSCTCTNRTPPYLSYLQIPCYFTSPSPPKIAAQIKSNSTPPPPPSIFISTNPAHVKPYHLRELYATCNHSCHRFPRADAAGRVEHIDELKLRIALSHSSIIVSAFTGADSFMAQSDSCAEPQSIVGIGRDWIRKVVPLMPENGRLVGFGRAVSDLGLTASIYDVVVHPALRQRGIDRMIVQRIVRMLTNRGIYDIAALCTDSERSLFMACGFGEDILGSTTMMYTRSISTNSMNERTVSAGRKLLLVPPQRELAP